MLGLAAHLSVGIFIALAFLFVEAFTMVMDAKPPMKFLSVAYHMILFYFGFSFLIALSLIGG